VYKAILYNINGEIIWEKTNFRTNTQYPEKTEQGLSEPDLTLSWHKWPLASSLNAIITAIIGTLGLLAISFRHLDRFF